jgi:molybdate transport system permease protein
VRRLFWPALAAAAALGFVFLALPLVALFLRVSPGKLFGQLGNSVVVDALVVSLKTSAIAHALVLVVGTPAAYALARHRFRGRELVLSLIELPLVLPPAVAGIALLAVFGRLGLLGGTLSALGISISFTQTAVVLAVAYVESPLYLRGAVAAFETVDERFLDASRTLGSGPARTFFRVALPHAAGGIIFAGSLQGVTQTLPLAIYAEFDRNFDAALAIGALFVLLGAALLLTLKLVPRWRAFTSISPFRSAASLST